MKLCLYLVLICQAFLLHGQTATEPVGTFDELSGSPFSTGNFPNSVAYSSILNGQLFAAVSNQSSSAISLYTVSSSGEFTSISGAFSVDRFPSGIAISPPLANADTCVVATPNSIGTTSTNITGSITAYLLNAANFGEPSMTQINGSPYLTSVPQCIAFSPALRGGAIYAATPCKSEKIISIFNVDLNTGAFSSASQTSTPLYPIYLAFSPAIDGVSLLANVVLTGGSKSNEIVVYQLDPSTGLLMEIFEFSLPTTSSANKITFSPIITVGDENILYAATIYNDTDYAASKISVYRVNTDRSSENFGTFTEISDSPYSLDTQYLGDIAYSPYIESTGDLFLGIVDEMQGTFSFSVNTSTGALTEVSGSPFIGGSRPFSIAFSPQYVGNLFSAVTNGNSANVSAYSLVLSPAPVANAQVTQEVVVGDEVVATTRAKEEFCRIDYINVVTWDPPKGDDSSIVGYRIFRDKKLKHLIAEKSSHRRLQFKERNVKPCKIYKYFIVSVDGRGNMSKPVMTKVKGKKFVIPKFGLKKSRKCSFCLGSC